MRFSLRFLMIGFAQTFPENPPIFFQRKKKLKKPTQMKNEDPNVCGISFFVSLCVFSLSKYQVLQKSHKEFSSTSTKPVLGIRVKIKIKKIIIFGQFRKLKSELQRALYNLFILFPFPFYLTLALQLYWTRLGNNGQREKERRKLPFLGSFFGKF